MSRLTTREAQQVRLLLWTVAGQMTWLTTSVASVFELLWAILGIMALCATLLAYFLRSIGRRRTRPFHKASPIMLMDLRCTQNEGSAQLQGLVFRELSAHN